MKQGIKKALVMLLSVAMVFTMMAMPVYADDFTETETNEVVLETPETVAEPVTEEAEQITETENKALEEAPVTAAETVEEEVTESAAELADGTYNATNLSTAVLNMYHFHDAQVVIKGDSAWFLTTEDYENDSTFDRYDGMAYGKQSEILDETDTTHKTLVEGTATATVVPVYDEDGTMITRTFVLPVPKSVFEANADIYYMIKYKDGYSEKHDGDWYKASGGDYYLTGYTLEYVSDSTVLPGEEEEPTGEPIELTITNNTGMFKAVTATALENADGSATLTFALSGSGYHWLYKGTYEEALAANEAVATGIAAGEGSDKLIKGYENADGKWEFQMAISADELGKEVAVVAISDSYYQKYVSGTNPLERAYYPRQFNLDLEAGTLVTGDYDMNYDFVLTTDLDDFKAASPVNVHIVGGPNSNNYSVAPTLVMNDTTYDKVTYPTVVSGSVSTATAELTDGKFAVNMVNAPNKAAFQDKTPLTFTFHVAEDAPYAEAGTDVERTVTFDQIAKTITVEGTALTPNEPGSAYPAGQYIVGVKSIKAATGADYTMFVPRYNQVNNTALVTVAEDGTATIYFDNNRNTYNAIFLGEPENLNQVPTDEQKASAAYIATKTSGSVAPFEFEFAFDTADLGKNVPYVTVSRSSGKFNAAQLAFVFDESMVPKAVYEVISMIDALPAAEDITVLDKDAIEDARAAYDALSAKQKAQVTNLDKLVAAEEAYAALPDKSEETIAVETAMGTLIQQYIDVNETTAAKVAETRAAYEALSTQQKAYVDAAALNKLYRAEACVAFANDGIAEGAVYDVGIDTSDSSPFIAATISLRSNAAYVYLYSVAELYNNANKISGTVSKSSHTVVGNGAVLKGLWQVQTDEGHGREFVIQLTGSKGNSDEYTVKVPGVYGVMAEGTYNVTAIQTPSSKMRKFERSTITSDGTAMTVEFVMPNTTYGKIFIGTEEEAAAATEGFIEPTGTEATSGTTGVGNVYKIPLESMYMPIIISYCNTGKNTWTEETIEFVVDEQAQAVIDAIAALNLNTYFNVKAEQREQVKAANELYNALDENQKAIVENSNYSTLKKVVAMFEIADIVAAEIEELPAADSITKDDVTAIREVKADFDGMGQSDIIKEALGKKEDGTWNTLQNSQIEKLIDQELRDKLNAAVAKADEFDKAVAAPVAAMIEALPDAEAVTVDDIEAIRAAAKAYDELTDAQKSFVENSDKLAACLAALADYTAVDAALATVPEDLSIYTEETAAAVTAAVNAVDRTKMAADQADVDAMAQAIEDAVKALKVDKFEYSGTTVQFIKKDGSAFGMWSAMEGSTFTYSDGKIHISIIPSNSKKTYSWMHWGGINEELTKDVTLTDDGKIELEVDTDLCGWAVPVAPIKTKDDTATTSSQYYLAIPALENFTTAADYTAVDAALAKVPGDLSIYTEETAAAATAAVDAVDRTKMKVEQAAVDAMAKAIEDAVKGLIEVVVLEDGTYALPDLAAGPSAMFNHFVADSKMLVVKGDKATLKFITDGSTSSIQKYSKIALGKSSELVTENYQESLPEGTTIIEGQLQPYEEGSTVDKYLFEIEMTKAEAELLLGNNVPDDIYIVVWNKVGSSADKIPGWYKASNDIYLSLGKLGALMPADYTAVDAALAKVPSDLSIYTESTAAAVTTAVNAVDRTKMSSEQAAVDAMAKAIEDAVAALEKKPADYSKVEAAKAAVPKDLSIYTDETAKAVTDAVAAVVEGKKIDEQAAVDAMAKAIEDAVAALELKPVFDPGLVTRIYGNTRYQTAILQAEELKEILGVEKFSNIIVATGNNYADALAGAYLGYVKKAPILLVRNDVLGLVKDYISNNIADGGTIYLLGGEAVVPGSVANGINGAKVQRLFGKDRYETNIAILKEAGVQADGVMICTGTDFADSLSASAAKLPILLVKGGLNDTQREYLKTLGQKNYYLVGGTGVLPAAMENEIKTNFGSVTRLGGKDRYETSVKVAEALFSDPETAVVAYAQNYPDGLCGGPLAASMNAPLLLVNDKHLDAAVGYTGKAGIKGGRILGGPALISDQSARKLFSMKDEDQIIVKK